MWTGVEECVATPFFHGTPMVVAEGMPTVLVDALVVVPMLMTKLTGAVCTVPTILHTQSVSIKESVPTLVFILREPTIAIALPDASNLRKP